jgi:polysaccharide biosynthesis transport protein
VQQHSEGLSLERAVGILRRRVPLIALCVVIVAAAAYGFSKRETKKYTATTSLVFNTNPLSQQIAGLPSSAVSSSALLAQESSNVELVRGGNAAAKTASLIGHGLTAEKVAASVSVTGQGESGLVDVAANSTSPVLAAEIANTYAQQSVKEQQNSQRHYYKSALAIVHKQLAALSRQERAKGAGVELQDRAQTLSFLSELREGNVKATVEAEVPTAPTSPKTSRNVALGIVLGLLIGLGIAFVLERLDRRIRGPEELERIYRLPLLGAVPASAAVARSARGTRGRGLSPAEAEAFTLIRAHLRFFNIDRDVRTVVIASPAPGDGKTAVARHLAEAAAKSGSRVLLLEADLRRPTLAKQFDIQSEPGLAGVLIGTVLTSQAIKSICVEAPPNDGQKGRTLDVLFAGSPLPPNPAELLESQAMDTLLQWAKFTYDLVVIDTPPLTAVSDAFPLLTKVDGVAIVGWVGRSRRETAEQLHQVLAGSGAPLLGVVANGSRSPSGYAYVGDGTSSAAVVSVDGSSSSGDLVPTAKA